MRTLIFMAVLIGGLCDFFRPGSNGIPGITDRPGKGLADDYCLVWADEFNRDGRPDTANWTYEKGFVRNEELQWYQPENAWCEKGCLIIEARREQKPNPGYISGSKDWRKASPLIRYTSACLLTKGLKSWKYGRFEMRARIDISAGLWPAWWTLGDTKPWPACGEIDIMEYYRGKLLANIARPGRDRRPQWHSITLPADSLGGPSWSSRFHLWRMDWDEKSIGLYVDEHLVNKVALTELVDPNDSLGIPPFQQPHYMLLNLAIGGMNGGDPAPTSFPRRFEVDYIHVYQRCR